MTVYVQFSYYVLPLSGNFINYELQMFNENLHNPSTGFYIDENENQQGVENSTFPSLQSSLLTYQPGLVFWCISPSFLANLCFYKGTTFTRFRLIFVYIFSLLLVNNYPFPEICILALSPILDNNLKTKNSYCFHHIVNSGFSIKRP